MSKQWVKPKRALSQNFLVSPAIIQDICHAINPQKSDHFVEIGPGEGALTEQLVDQCAHYSALEIDDRLIPLLQHKFGHAAHFHLNHTDALTYAYMAHPAKPYRIVGNLPYHISSPLILRFIEAWNVVTDMHLMFQKEVAQSLCAKRGKCRSRLTLIVQLFCHCEHLFDIPPDAFNPAPKVTSSVIRLTPRKQLAINAQQLDAYRALVKLAFAHKRKTLSNNLSKIIDKQALIHLNIDPKSRAENLSVDNVIAILNALTPEAIQRLKTPHG